MLFCKRSLSNSIGIASWMSRPLGCRGGARCRCCGSLAASTSMRLLWVDVCDFATGSSDVASDVLLELVSRCSSCAWLSRDCTASMVSAVACGSCCRSMVSSRRCAGGCGLAL